ncbi:TraR/DksA C4-type zinc finger protein [Pseudomonas sp. EpS/L25]|uniref:TraR/DksA C4-type zinc finger protein n=1 Tax=Pseudomonas sp. EpS/L25 TaxID=1749078 RepID=UPI000743FC13|nr:TraR/DksA C4-type zinc finger protein [Pseudomonas sp. EpS/L25]KUM34135.1 RNA polymerase-binding protein DksA [Pseudomonas sp. EpS/L25]
MTPEELLAQPESAYMNEAQRAFFRELLLDQRTDLQRLIDEQMADLRGMETHGDPADVGNAEQQRQWQLRQLEREKRLLDKIDDALERLVRDEYEWCEETGEPIGLARLLLRPTATLSVEAKERQEQRERHMQSS